jgi:hypothetical protein
MTVNEGDGDMKKAIITIGLAAVLGIAPLAMAGVDSNSIIKDNIEYYFQTDKFIYTLGENVEMLYRVTNLGENDVTFHFIDQVQYKFMVEQNENLIWYTPKAGFPAESSFVLQPSEYKEYTKAWNMHDNQGVIVTPGIYDVTGSLHPVLLVEQDRYVPVSVSIDIIPEPASSLLFGTGLIVVLARNRTNFKK